MQATATSFSIASNLRSAAADVEHLFVYGTLRMPVGGPAEDTHFNDRIAALINHATPARLDGAILYNLGPYPAVVEGAGAVIGDLLSVDPAAVPITDEIEGHPGYYERRPANVVTDAGEMVQAWVYFAPAQLVAGHVAVEHGDWFNRDRTAAVGLASNADPEFQRHIDRIAADGLG